MDVWTAILDILVKIWIRSGIFSECLRTKDISRQSVSREKEMIRAYKEDEMENSKNLIPEQGQTFSQKLKRVLKADCG